MKRMYVTVEDLIKNSGEFCTILRRKPDEDYITIVEDDSTNFGSIMIILHNGEILVWRKMEPGKRLKDDLNYVRMKLFRLKMCDGCCHLGHYGCCMCKGDDNLDNFKIGSCPNYREPEKSTGTFWDYMIRIG